MEKYMKNVTTFLSVLLAILMTAVPTECLSQNNAVEIRGQVTTENKDAIEGVSVFVNSGGRQYEGRTNGEGRYSVAFEPADTVTVGFRHLSYEPQNLRIIVGGNRKIRQDVTMTELGRMLEGVTVESGSRLLKDDRVVYLPTRQQLNGTHDAMGLLFNMMIPTLNVDLLSSSISTVDNTSLAVLVDGREVSADELRKIRAKDIMRVEYDENPTGLYANYDRVVNIIKKKYDSGGYVDVQAHQQFLSPDTRGQVQTSFDRKGCNLLAQANGMYSRSDNHGSTKRSTYRLDKTFEKLYTSLIDKSRNNSNSGLLRGTWSGKHHMFMAQTSLSWTETPNSYRIGRVEYTPAVYETATSTEHRYSKSLTPSAMLYHQWTIDKTQGLMWTLDYWYMHSNYNRTYAEGDLPVIYTFSKEDMHHAAFTARYSKTFRHNNSLSLLLWQVYRRSSSAYRGSTQSDQRLSTYDLLFYPTYSQTFFRKLSVSVQMGFDLNTYEVNSLGHVTKLWPRPNLSLNYRIDKGSSLNLSCSMGTSAPNISSQSTAVQKISEFEYTRGNPDLEASKTYRANLSYSRFFKKASLSLFANLNYTEDFISNYYDVQEGVLVGWMNNNGSFNTYQLGTTASFTLFDRLQLKLTGYYDIVDRNGYRADDKKSFWMTSSMYCPFGNFAVQLSYSSPKNTLRNDYYYKSSSVYYMMLTYKKGGFYAQAGCAYPFNHNKEFNRSRFDYGCYAYENREMSRETNRWVFVSMIYSFDFGRKVKREKVEIEKGSSGLLTM